MADGDFTKWSYFEDMKLIQFMNILLYQRDKQDYYERIAQINKNKRG